MVTRKINDDITLAYLLNKTLERAYPVGSIYMSMNPTDPGKLFGGKWERIAGRFLLAASDTDGGSTSPNRTVGNTGGSANAVVPYHRHTAMSYTSGLGQSGTSIPRWYQQSSSSGENKAYTSYAGTSGNATGANMPPYLAVYMWQRES